MNPRLGDITLVKGDNELDVQMVPTVGVGLGGYSWQDPGFPSSVPTNTLNLININKLVPRASNLRLGPSKSEVLEAIENPLNVFYMHLSHGLPGVIAYINTGCPMIRARMENRLPFRFVYLVSCYCMDEYYGYNYDSLPKAFTKDFSDPLSVVIGYSGPDHSDFFLCVTYFFYLLARPENIDVPLYELYLRSEVTKAGFPDYPYSKMSAHYSEFAGSQVVTPGTLFVFS